MMMKSVTVSRGVASTLEVSCTHSIFPRPSFRIRMLSSLHLSILAKFGALCSSRIIKRTLSLLAAADSTEIDTTVTVTSDDTVIEVEGHDATSTLEAAREAAEDAGILDEGLIQEPEYIKSVVHGGLDISLTSLGVVASAAGGDAKTRKSLS